MKILVIPAKELSREHVVAWAALQRADRSIDSPFFRPEFTQAVAQVRDDVEVAILEHDNLPVGFFPFQRGYGNVGRPVGGRLSDFQGLVLHPDHTIGAAQLIRGCRLSAWHFDHLIAAQMMFQECQWAHYPSPYIDTSQDFDAYQTERRQAGSETLAKTFRKLRKLQREVGPVRFQMTTTDEQVLQTLIRWKAEQYRRSKIINLFAFGWTEQLLRVLLQKTDVACSGVMSAWYLNDELAAIHYGIRSHHVLHGWFPAYRADLSRHSPGSQVLIEIIKAAHGLGIERIDLGRGPEPYKVSFMSGAIPVAEGSVDSRPATRALRKLWHRTHRWVRESPLRGPATVPWRLMKHVRDQIQYR